MFGKILKVIFFLIIVGVILYVFKSGLIGTSLRQIVFFAPHSSSTGAVILPPIATNPTGTPQTANNINPAVGTSTATSTPVPTDIPAGFTASQLSPAFHQVRLGGVSYGGFGYYGQITLNAQLPASAGSTSSPPATLDITGWQIKTVRSGEYIPQAVNVYDPSGLTPATDIQVRNGDTVYLFSSNGPFNLRLNKCIGYIAKQNPTVPALPISCPYPDRSGIQNFTGACQSYILSIGSCQVPDLNNPQIPTNDYSCRNYIANNFNYQACFGAHTGDADFLSNQIWVWMGSNVVDQYHDTVRLFDRQGLLVDMYTY